MAYNHRCPICHCYLGHGERCDCGRSDLPDEERPRRIRKPWHSPFETPFTLDARVPAPTPEVEV